MSLTDLDVLGEAERVAIESDRGADVVDGEHRCDARVRRGAVEDHPPKHSVAVVC
jgi:hypothetical protein